MKGYTKFLTFIFMFLMLSLGTAKSQMVDIKKWTGTYPDMEDSYPLAFIAFKGKIISVPHVFVRTWPSHYYVEVGALPVTDSPEIAGRTKTGLLRIVAKMLERQQAKGRYHEKVQIKENTTFQKQIEEKIFNSRFDQLQDLFNLSQDFINLYNNVERMEQLPNASEIKKIFENEADQLLLRFLMVNLLQTNHGEKLDAFSKISVTLNKLMGVVDYTYAKISFYKNHDQEQISYAFLTH